MQNDKPASSSPLNVLHRKLYIAIELKWQTCFGTELSKFSSSLVKGLKGWKPCRFGQDVGLHNTVSSKTQAHNKIVSVLAVRYMTHTLIPLSAPLRMFRVLSWFLAVLFVMMLLVPWSCSLFSILCPTFFQRLRIRIGVRCRFVPSFLLLFERCWSRRTCAWLVPMFDLLVIRVFTPAVMCRGVLVLLCFLFLLLRAFLLHIFLDLLKEGGDEGLLLRLGARAAHI